MQYHPVLKIILKHAPKGLPTKSLLRITWAELNRNHDIMTEYAKKHCKGVDDRLDQATDRAATVCRDVRDLSKSRTEYAAPLLKELMDMIDISDGSASLAESTAGGSAAKWGRASTSMTWSGNSFCIQRMVYLGTKKLIRAL